MPRYSNLFDIFGLGFFYGAEPEPEMEDTLVSWESMNMMQPIIN